MKTTWEWRKKVCTKPAKKRRGNLLQWSRSNNYVHTYNTQPKKRLLEFFEKCPCLCKIIFKGEEGWVGFEINKENFTFRCMRPASDEKRGDAQVSIASRFLCAVRRNIDMKKSEPLICYEAVRICSVWWLVRESNPCFQRERLMS